MVQFVVPPKEYVPAAQLLQAVAPRRKFAYVDAGHGVQEPALDALNVPDGQSVQSYSSARENFPATQGVEMPPLHENPAKHFSGGVFGSEQS